MAKSSVVARVLDGDRLKCQIVSPRDGQLMLTGSTTDLEPTVEGSIELSGNRGGAQPAWRSPLRRSSPFSSPLTSPSHLFQLTSHSGDQQSGRASPLLVRDGTLRDFGALERRAALPTGAMLNSFQSVSAACAAARGGWSCRVSSATSSALKPRLASKSTITSCLGWP